MLRLRHKNRELEKSRIILNLANFENGYLRRSWGGTNNVLSFMKVLSLKQWHFSVSCS